MKHSNRKSKATELGFFRRLGKNIKEYLAELLGSFVIYLVVLGIIQLVGFLILKLDLPDHQKTLLKNFDFVVSLILIFFFAATSLYKLGKIFINENPELKSISSRVTHLSQTHTTVNGTSRITRKDVFHKIAEVLCIASLLLTLYFAVNDHNSLFSFAIPIAGLLKGLLVISDLPADIRVFATICLLMLVGGGTIVASHAVLRKDFVLAWTISATSSLGVGLGMLAGVAQILLLQRRSDRAGK